MFRAALTPTLSKRNSDTSTRATTEQLLLPLVGTLVRFTRPLTPHSMAHNLYTGRDWGSLARRCAYVYVMSLPVASRGDRRAVDSYQRHELALL